MRLTQVFLVSGFGLAAVPFAIATAPPAAADCTSSGGVTICSQGEVRAADSAPSSGPYVPYPCEYDWYCGDDGLDIILDPGPPAPPVDVGRPGRPGRPGGPR